MRADGWRTGRIYHYSLLTGGGLIKKPFLCRMGGSYTVCAVVLQAAGVRWDLNFIQMWSLQMFY